MNNLFLALLFLLLANSIHSQNCYSSKYKNELKYCYIVKNKSGSKPKPFHIVQVLYTLSLEDGTVISSYTDTANSFDFILDNDEVLPGWNLAVKMMRTGERMRFSIPPHMAYKNASVGKIKPNSVLILEITLLGHYSAFYTELNNIREIDDNGLKYKIFSKKNNLDTIIPGNYILFNYTAYTINSSGKRNIFDSSKNSNAIIQYGVNNLIPGLEQGISKMKVGDFATFVIPPHLAYGNKRMKLIPPNSTLGFDIQIREQINPFNEYTDSCVFSNDSSYMYTYFKKHNNKQCELNDLIHLNLVGYYHLDNGVKKIFESSYEKNKPFSFRLNKFVENPAWYSLLLSSSQGDRGLLKIPFQFARMELKKLIPENKDVYFEFEIVNITKPNYYSQPFVDSIFTENGIELFFKSKSNQNNKSLDTSSTIVIDYLAYYLDSLNTIQVFDSTKDRKKPFQFKYKPDEVIEGLYAAMQYLGVGDRAKIIIPYKFAYGTKGFPPTIPPQQDLIFDIEVLDID